MSSSNLSHSEEPGGVRLQKVLAAAGFGSRRKCEELIDQGRVSVDGVRVETQGMRVDPHQNVVRVDDKRIAAPEGTVVFALNKPRGVLTAMSDDRSRRCVGDLVAESEIAAGVNGLFHVGRLDSETDGLLLLTNDGDLGHLLTHPSFGVNKTYVAGVKGQLRAADVARIGKGILVDDRVVEVTKPRLIGTRAGESVIELTIHEGRKHVVRRLLANAGFPVETLTRTRFGPIDVKGLAAGELRQLSTEQISSLYDAVEQPIQ
jgi:23S rRNA pseudouridine2605 synthase